MITVNGFYENAEFMILDISGVSYYLLEDTVFFNPTGLLATLWKAQKNPKKLLPKNIYRTKQKNKFFVQRSPELFDLILQCYITGKIHIPYWLCRKTIENEMNFWKLEERYRCHCCVYDDDDSSGDNNINEETIKELQENAPKKGWRDTKKRLWQFLENPNSSVGALVFAIVSMLFVFISIGNLVTSSISEFHLCPENATEIYSVKQMDKVKESLQTSLYDFNNSLLYTNMTTPYKPEGVLRFFSNCLGMQKFEILEIICLLWFTFEMGLRFFSCPSKLKFFTPLNVIDVLACFPLYIEILLWLFRVNSKKLSFGLLLIFRCLRTVTVLRILKLSRYSKDLRILGNTLLSAKKELFMLSLFLFVSVLVYSSLLYQVEHDEPNTKFTSVPATMWWAIVTLTTVGYGDMCPTTTAGKFVGIMTCMTGIMIVALPVSVLIEHFVSTYNRINNIPLGRRLNSGGYHFK